MGKQKSQHGEGERVSAAERRIHPRYLDEVRIRFRDIEGFSPSSWGRSRDISLGGLGLVTDNTVSLGCHLALEIHIKDESAPILALGRVLRCEEEEGGYVSGLQFLWVSEEDRTNLRRLADYFRNRHGNGE